MWMMPLHLQVNQKSDDDMMMMMKVRIEVIYIWALTRENLSSGVWEQHRHSHSLISAFVIHVLESTISKLATSEI